MKYCHYCGHPLEDYMNFCTECGTKLDTASQRTQEIPKQTPTHTTYYEPWAYPLPQKHRKARQGMIILTIICFISAVVMGLASFAETKIIFMAAFYAIFGVMFLLLSLSPKDSIYLFGNYNSLKKRTIVTLCVISAFVIFSVGVGIIVSTPNQIEESTHNQHATYDSNSNSNTTTTNPVIPAVEETEVTTMADIQQWYMSQMPAVGQALSDYAQSIDGLTVLTVNDSKFRFGEDSGWYDCHYTFYFTCKINGVSYDGEARAFMKYNDNTVNWFHFEIFSNDSLISVVEYYDDSYDQIIEDYYKELERLYG